MGSLLLARGMLTISVIKLIGFVATLILGLLLVLMLHNSRLGQAIRATAGFLIGAEYQAAFVCSLLVVILVGRNFWLVRKREYLK
jgi:hypothetical protein